MASTRSEIRRALLDAINEDKELRALVEGVPDKVAGTVEALTPVDEGTARRSIEVKARRTAYKRLSTRRVKIGSVYSDDDPAKINALEFGRGADTEHGETPEFAMFRRAAARWADMEL